MSRHRIRRVLVAAGAWMMLVSAVGCERTGPASAPEDLDSEGMKQAVARALATSDAVDRMSSLATALQRLDAGNVSGGAEAVLEAAPFIESCELRPFAGRWASFDPAGALDFSLNSMPRGDKRMQAAGAAIAAWVPTDRGASVSAYIANLEEEGSLNVRPLKSQLLRGLVAHDYLEETGPLLAEMPDDEARHALLMHLVLDLMRKDRARVIEWVRSVPVDAANNLKPKLFSRALTFMAMSDPERAAAWYDEDGYQDFVQEDAIALVGTLWAKKDPYATFEWMLSLPPSDSRDTAIRGVVYRWQLDDPESSEPWLRARLASEDMRPALYPFAQWMVYQDPVEAIAWGLRVPDERERFYVIQQAFLLWVQQDKAAAMAWYEKVDLPRELRRDIDGMLHMTVKRTYQESAPETDEAKNDEDL